MSAPGSPIRVLLAESQTLLRAGVRALLDEQTGLIVAAEAVDAAAALDAAATSRADAAVVALALRGSPALSVVTALVRDYGVPVVALADDDAPDALLAAVDAGARAVVTRRAPGTSLIEAVRSVAGGRRWYEPDLARLLDRRSGVALPAAAPGADLCFRWAALTGREREVAELVAAGRAYREVGERLGISEHTVRNHLRHIYDKLDINSRLELALAGAHAVSGPEPLRAKIGSL